MTVEGSIISIVGGAAAALSRACARGALCDGAAFVVWNPAAFQVKSPTVPPVGDRRVCDRRVLSTAISGRFSFGPDTASEEPSDAAAHYT